jgi:hypothetical protein
VPVLNVQHLAATVLAFFLAVGLAAHALDELVTGARPGCTPFQRGVSRLPTARCEARYEACVVDWTGR